MIIRQRGVDQRDFIRLVNYLSSEQPSENRLKLEDMLPYSSWIRAGEGEMVTLVIEGDPKIIAFETGYNPFARLLTAKVSYDGADEQEWAVEVLIPDHFHLGVIDTAEYDTGTAKVKKSTHFQDFPGCPVKTGRFALEISDIVTGATRRRDVG